MNDTEYSEEIVNRKTNGGVVWAIERTDTHEFLRFSLSIRDFHDPFPEPQLWTEWDSFFTKMFLTQEDANKFISDNKFIIGGCPCCGNGGTPIPVIATEHEFVSNRNL